VHRPRRIDELRNGEATVQRTHAGTVNGGHGLLTTDLIVLLAAEASVAASDASTAVAAVCAGARFTRHDK